MRDHVEIGHLTKFDVFRDLEICFKIHTNVSNFETASPKTIQTLKIVMISVIVSKIGNHSDFQLSFFRIEVA